MSRLGVVISRALMGRLSMGLAAARSGASRASRTAAPFCAGAHLPPGAPHQSKGKRPQRRRAGRRRAERRRAMWAEWVRHLEESWREAEALGHDRSERSFERARSQFNALHQRPWLRNVSWADFLKAAEWEVS